MHLGIFAKTFVGSNPAAVLLSAREAGYTTVQYNMACSGLPSLPEGISAGVAKDVREAAAKAGVTISAISATYNMAHPNPEVRRRGHLALSTIAAAAPAMNTRLLTLCTGSRDPDDQWRAHPDNCGRAAWRDLLTSMEAALTVAEAANIELAIEPELANVIDSSDRARELIDALKSDRVKVILDPANMLEIGSRRHHQDIVSRACDLLGDRLAMAHAKDRSADGSVVPCGQGIVDFRHFFACLRAIGFHGPVITHGLSAADAAPVERYLRSCEHANLRSA